MRRYYGFSAGRRTLKRALLGLSFLVLLVVLLTGIWHTVDYLTTRSQQQPQQGP